MEDCNESLCSNKVLKTKQKTSKICSFSNGCVEKWMLEGRQRSE